MANCLSCCLVALPSCTSCTKGCLPMLNSSAIRSTPCQNVCMSIPAPPLGLGVDFHTGGQPRHDLLRCERQRFNHQEERHAAEIHQTQHPLHAKASQMLDAIRHLVRITHSNQPLLH